MKRYSSISEITSEASYRPQNPLSQQNYRRLKGPYALGKGEELECCCLKPNGNLCDQRHKRGWVAELHDETSTVLGGTCAVEKFGADSTITRDIAVATNKMARLDEIVRLGDLLRERDAKLAALEGAKRQLVDMKRTLANYRRNFGLRASNVLTEMSRAGTASIRVLGIVPPEYDGDGELLRDRQEVLIEVATIAGIAVCNPARIETTLSDLRKIEEAYKQAGAGPEREFKRKEVKALVAALANQDRVMTAVSGWLDEFKRFEANDFAALAFTVVDLRERQNLVHFAIRRTDPSASRDAAKRKLQALESGLRQAHNVKRIQIR